MSVRIEFSISATRALRRSNKAALIATKIEELAAEPGRHRSNIKALKGTDQFRLRVQDWRAIFRIVDRVLYVDQIGPRGGIYRD